MWSGDLSFKKIMADFLLCYWQMKRAWEKKIRTEIKVQGSIQDNILARNKIRSILNKFIQFKSEYEENFGAFFKYFNDQ
jgi:DNA-directed RNA polymerase subunit L